MIYERKIKKKILAMFIVSTFVISTFMSCFSKLNKVEAIINSNLPVSHISDDFPASYKPYIDALKKFHPNWIFKAVYTGLDWNQSVTQECYDTNESISLVPDSVDGVWKKDGQNYYKDGNFVIASKQAVKYMLDPRGHLNEKEVFQFQTLSYSSSMDNIDSIEKVLYGTSMYNRNEYQRLGSMINMGTTYSNIILEAAKTYNVSAIHLASRIKQETGGAITSNRSINGSTSVNGVVPYNFFNIGATPPNAISNGLDYAAKKGWTNPDIAIKGGASVLVNSYIKWGQDTTYFQKFDVNNPYGNAKYLYGSQYMANILAPTNESYSTYTSYQKMGMLDNTLEFHIPVYDNMSDYPSAYPGEDDVTYVADNTIITGYNLDGAYLNVRSGPGTSFSIVGTLRENEQATRIAKSTNTQWDKVRLSNGVEGYVFRDYTKDVPNIKVTGLTLDKQNLNLKIGENYNLTCTITPDNAADKNVEWSSSNSDIVSVDNGKVTANSTGTAVISVKNQASSLTTSCNVTVTANVESISLEKNEYTMLEGSYLTITPIISPDYATDKEYSISSDNDNVIKIENEKLKAISEGTANVTFTTKDQNKSVTAKITVIKKEDNALTFNSSVNITEDKITKIEPGTTANDMFSKLEYNKDKYDVVIKNLNGDAISNNYLVGTGTTINLVTKGSNEQVQTYYVIIYGDVNGDGEIDVVDLLLLKRQITKKVSLSGDKLAAASISNKNGNPDVTDLLRLKRHITGKLKIEQ